MKKNIIWKTAEFTIIIFWLIAMQSSDSFFIPYLLVGILSLFCCYKRSDFSFRKPKNIATIIFALIFTFFVSAANYSLFPAFDQPTAILHDIIQIVSIVLGSFCAFFNILIYTPNILEHISFSTSEPPISSSKPHRVFLISFAIIAAVYLIIFLTCKIPGGLSFDSLHQIKQGLEGNYTAHYPLMPTLIVHAFIQIGLDISGSLNVGVALISIAQIIVIAASFAFTIMTLHQANFPRKFQIVLLLIFALSPYHIINSYTIWKDILFAIFILLFVVTEYRIFKNIGTKWLNYFLLGFSVLFSCLFRNNGIFIILITIVFFSIAFFKLIIHQKSYRLNLIVIILSTVCYFIINPMLISGLNASKGSTIEALSIPLQQIARTLRDSDDLTETQLSLLSNIFQNVDTVPEVYEPYISDNVKAQVLFKGDGEQYLLEHKIDYLKLYLKLGITHPVQYFQAWVDQTKGYFNGGYYYWVVNDTIGPNELYIERKIDAKSPQNQIIDNYLRIFDTNYALRIIYCIGFHVWIAIWLLYVAIIKKDRQLSFLVIIPLSLIATLLIATPVFSEFRYAYPLFCCLPFLFIVSLDSAKSIKTSSIKKHKKSTSPKKHHATKLPETTV